MAPRSLFAFLLAGLAGCSAPSGSPTLGPSPTPEPPLRQPTMFPPGELPPAPRAPTAIVLVPGFNAFKSIGSLDYFYGVAAALGNRAYSVSVADLDPYNSSAVRGAQLLAHIDSVLAAGADHVDLICHSQGGMDCRWAAAHAGSPSRIGAMLLVATPNRGTPVADLAQQTDTIPGQAALAFLVNLFGRGLSGGQADPDVLRAIDQLSSSGAAEFNAAVPDVPGVRYYSMAGRSNDSSGDLDCQAADEAPFIGRYDLDVDSLNVLLSVSGGILDQAVPPVTHDGMVSVTSARWGTFLGCIPADHWDEICQIAGQSNGVVDCGTLYTQLADWLVAHD